MWASLLVAYSSSRSRPKDCLAAGHWIASEIIRMRHSQYSQLCRALVIRFRGRKLTRMSRQSSHGCQDLGSNLRAISKKKEEQNNIRRLRHRRKDLKCTLEEPKNNCKHRPIIMLKLESKFKLNRTQLREGKLWKRSEEKSLQISLICLNLHKQSMPNQLLRRKSNSNLHQKLTSLQ